MNVCVDVVDPLQGNEMVMFSVWRIRLREFDALASLEIVHRSDMLAVGRFDFHMVFDVAG
jgi:hypothetical protein